MGDPGVRLAALVGGQGLVEGGAGGVDDGEPFRQVLAAVGEGVAEVVEGHGLPVVARQFGPDPGRHLRQGVGPAGRRAGGCSSAARRMRRRSPGAGGSGGGASSRTTWALVPPKPKEFTPARAGPSWAGQSVGRVGISYGRVVGSMAGLSRSRLMWGWIVRCSMLRTVLIRPAIPAADSVWPMFVLTEPT
ncbi:hypothetical protein SBADM41S_07302 [Streptomyces badius]